MRRFYKFLRLRLRLLSLRLVSNRKKIMRNWERTHPWTSNGGNGRGPIVYLLGDSILDSADYVLERPGVPGAGAISAEADRFSKLPRTDLIHNFEQDFWFWHPYQMPDVPYWLNKNIRENKVW